MAENYSFRSSMNGFNRSDVMAYLENLLNEKAAVEEKVSSLEADKVSLEEKIESLEKKCADIESEKTAIMNENDKKIAYYDQKFLDIKEVELKASSLEVKLSDAETEIAFLRSQLESFKKAEAVKDKCEECELVRVYEARLGAAMLDAKRFSEILVKEANDKASGLFASAYASADLTSVKAKKISEEIAGINEQFNMSFRVLLENMAHLEKSLDAFKCDMNETGATYNFSTDFEPVKIGKTSSTDSTDSDAEKKPVDILADYNKVALNSIDDQLIKEKDMTRDVNFDDADEFDIKVDLNAWKKY